MALGWIERVGRERSLSFGADVLALLALSLMVVALWIPRAEGPLDLRWDGSVYYILGTSIAEGKGYRLLNEPGEIQSIQYPPLLPLLVAAHQTVLGTSDPVIVGTWLKLTYFAFHAGLIFATYFLLKMFVPPWLAFGGALALLLNVQVVFHSNLLFAEVPFALLSVLFVLCLRQGGAGIYSVLAAVLAVTAFFLRTAGVALLAAWVVESLVRKRFKQAAIRLLIAAIPFVGWNAYVLHVQQSPAYTEPAYPYQRAPYLNYNVDYTTNVALVDAFSVDHRPATGLELAERFWSNARKVPLDLGEAVSDSRGFWRYVLPFGYHYIPLLLLAGGILLGLVVLVGRGEILIPVYIGVSVMLMYTTPWPEQFRRYLVPMAPFLLVALFCGTHWVMNRIGTARLRLVRIWAPVPVVVVLALIAYAQVNALRGMYRWHLDPITWETWDGTRVDYRIFYYRSDSKAFDAALDWLGERTGPEDVVAMPSPHWAYLRNRFKAVRPPLEPDPERAQALLDAVPARFVLLKFGGEMPFVAAGIAPVIEAHPEAWQLVYQDAEEPIRIYERVRLDGDE